MSSPDGVAGRLVAEGGLGLVVCEACDGLWPQLDTLGPGQMLVGIHRAGERPLEGLEPFDILLSADPLAPRPWVGLSDDQLTTSLATIRANVAAQPVASLVLIQVLRMSLKLSFDQALAAESLGYSLLLASEGFRRWRQSRPVRTRTSERADRVNLYRDNGALHLQLARPEAHNAFDAQMRDALVEALEFARDDPEASAVVLHGEGASFSAGGDLDEFGAATDVGLAHAIRVLQSPARLINGLGPRLTVRLHGACIGAGIEAPAAAAHVIADSSAWFRLPEVSMGLIPGAGGTATLPRRIGRRRTGYMAMTGLDVSATTALDWGLIDVLEPS